MVDDPLRLPRGSKPRINPTRLAEAAVVCITAAILLALVLPGSVNGVSTARGPLFEIVIPVAMIISLTAAVAFAVSWLVVKRKHW